MYGGRSLRGLVMYFLPLFAIICCTQGTLIVHLSNFTSHNDIYFQASYAPTSPTPFHLYGDLYVMETTDIEELRSLDLDGAIVLGSRVNTTQEDFLFSKLVYEKNGAVFSSKLYQSKLIRVFRATLRRSRANSWGWHPSIFPLPVVSIIYEDALAVADLWIRSNRTLTVTIISDDNEQMSVGQSGGSVFLIVMNLVILLATLVYVCTQLHSFKKGASVTKIALLGILLANLGLIAERIIMLLFIFTPYITTLVPIPISIIGPMFIAFSAVFISLYWSTLAFPTTIKMKSKQVSLPILAFALAAFAAFTLTVAFDLAQAALIIQICFVIIALIIATYYVIMGGVLIRTLNKGNKIVATKRKITKRLTYMLILTGISLYGIVTVAILMSLYFGPPISVFYTTRAILSLFCACSIATLAALFKKPSSKSSKTKRSEMRTSVVSVAS